MEARKLSDSPAPAFGLSLRIRHPSIDPAEISRELQLEPEHSFRAGEPRNSSSGLKATALHAESYWLAALDPSAPLSAFAASLPAAAAEGLRARAAIDRIGLDAALMLWTTHFARRHAALFQRIVAEGGQIGLLIEVAPDGVRSFSLSPAIGRSLAELGIALEFEFEPADG
jgi:hypothetical protein